MALEWSRDDICSWSMKARLGKKSHQSIEKYLKLCEICYVKTVFKIYHFALVDLNTIYFLV